MENTSSDACKNGLDRKNLLFVLSNNTDLGLVYSEAKLKRLVRRVNSQHTLVLKSKPLRRNKSCVKNSFLRSVRVLDGWIPKHIITVDEIYLRRCLEFIHITASKAAPCDIFFNFGWRDMEVLSDGFAFGNPCDLSTIGFGAPLASDDGNGDGDGDVVVSSAGQWIVGSIMGSKSMVNLLKSPLLRQYGAYDDDSSVKKGTFNDVKRSLEYDFMGSPGESSSYSSNKLDNDGSNLGNFKHGLETLHERLISMSSLNSNSSDCSSSVSASVTQGMLQCTWKSGNPHFIFSLDDQKMVYEAKLWKVDSADDNGLDYIYLIHSKKGGERGHGVDDSDSLLVGKIKLSTSFSLCPSNSRIMERNFVLYGGNENFVGEMQSHEVKKNKRLSKKVAEVFRNSYSVKKRTSSRLGGSSSMLDNFSWEPFRGLEINNDALRPVNLLENDLPANLELAAVIVKEHLPENRQEKVGGWGMKFLKKVGVKQIGDATENLLTSPCCDRDTGSCSTSLDVLVPAGPHGGPRSRHDGPSSLIERWRSDGCCDCGGWDLGCPITVLKSRSSENRAWPQADQQGESKLIDLFIQGSQNGASPLKIVNVYDGLYFVRFQSTLSALQSFSIAVAFVHAQSPALQPRNVQK